MELTDVIIPDKLKEILKENHLSQVQAYTEDAPFTTREMLLSLEDNIAFLENTSVSLEDYIKAVNFASLMYSGISNLKAYMATFPERCNKSKKKISHSMYAYMHTKTVKSICSKQNTTMNSLFHAGRMKVLHNMQKIALNDTDNTIKPQDQINAATVFLKHTEIPEDHSVKVDNTDNSTIINANTIEALQVIKNNQKEILQKQQDRFKEKGISAVQEMYEPPTIAFINKDE